MADEKLPAVIEQASLKPAEVTKYAREAATELINVVEKAGMVITVNKQKYLRFEGWQTLGVFARGMYGGPVTAGAEEADPVEDGFRARARAWCNGVVVSEAVAYCLRSESNWKNKPDFQLASMAQTRATAKALRNILGWVLTLAGADYKTTPAEEMDDGPPSELFDSFTTRIAEAKNKDDIKAIYDDLNKADLKQDERADLKSRYNKKAAEIKAKA